jgi:hypothetical protein
MFCVRLCALGAVVCAFALLTAILDASAQNIDPCAHALWFEPWRAGPLASGRSGAFSSEVFPYTAEVLTK